MSSSLSSTLASFLPTNLHYGSLATAVIGIAASPTIWNIIARNEYHHHTLTERVWGGNKQAGCYTLAAWIFGSSLLRDKLVHIAIDKNNKSSSSSSSEKSNRDSGSSSQNEVPLNLVDPRNSSALSYLRTSAKLIFAGGTVLVASAYYRLGITYTYLGDYFGLLMSERVTAFPFSVCNDPMYVGSSLCFLGLAMQENSTVGVALSGWIWTVYKISTKYFEDPFTEMIYANRNQ